MRKRDAFDVTTSLVAVAADAAAIFAGLMLAAAIRFDSGWVPMIHDRPLDVYNIYSKGSAVAALVMLFVYRTLGLYVRPQLGSFGDKIPRVVRATGIGALLSMILAFVVKNTVFSFSTAVIVISFFTTALIVLLEKYVLFRVELSVASSRAATHRVLIMGTGPTAAHLVKAIAAEPRLRSETIGFLRTDLSEPEPSIAEESILGTVEQLENVLSRSGPEVDEVILTDSGLSHDRIVKILVLCEKNLAGFKLVPDIFRILTGNVDVQIVGDVPLLGVGHWPLDMFWNRVVKRLEDILGAAFGLLLASPVVLVAAIAVKRSSRGPAFYVQERCGEGGRIFKLYKLRTMRVDAESETGPVWASEEDPRRTRVGAFLRAHNIDELPQLWNVLRGDMSLVGPRPERPHFVEQFKEEIQRYMWRHVSKPGLTGWAQVNGLRGNTSLRDRIQHDLYYLEKWSLAFDFKILARTIFAKDNAY